MTTLKGGLGRSDITPRKGTGLVGYGGRDEGNVGIHDRLTTRALVLESEDGGSLAKMEKAARWLGTEC